MRRKSMEQITNQTTNQATNQVTLIGIFKTDFEKDYETHGLVMYKAEMSIRRKSGNEDTVVIKTTEEDLATSSYVGKTAIVRGFFRSANVRTGEKSKMILYVFTKNIRIVNRNVGHKNRVQLDGYIAKNPIYRTTTLGREVADVIIAVHRPRIGYIEKSDYIPCVFWFNNAKRAKELKPGDKIDLVGSIRSREYLKKIDETHTETRTAFEVSVNGFRGPEEGVPKRES